LYLVKPCSALPILKDVLPVLPSTHYSANLNERIIVKEPFVVTKPLTVAKTALLYAQAGLYIKYGSLQEEQAKKTCLQDSTV
jgi:hypothetical protein